MLILQLFLNSYKIKVYEYNPKLSELMVFFHLLTFLGISAHDHQRDQTETGDETEGTLSVRCLQEGDDREVGCNAHIVNGAVTVVELL